MTWVIISQLIIILLAFGVTTTSAAGGCAIPGGVLSDVVCGNGVCDIKTSGPGVPFSENKPYSPCCCAQDCPGVVCKFECVDPIVGTPIPLFTCGDGSCVKTAAIENYTWMDEDNPNGPCCCEKDCPGVICAGKSTTTTVASTTSTTSAISTTTTNPNPTTTTIIGPTTTINSTDPGKGIEKRVNEVVCTLFNVVVMVAGGIAALMIIIAGLKYTTAGENPGQADDAKKMVSYAFIGLLMVAIACPLVDYLVSNTNIVPFEKSCKCFFYSGGGNGSTTTTGGTTTTTISNGTTTSSSGGTTLSSTTTTTTIPASELLTAENLVACINSKGIFYSDGGCHYCIIQKNLFYAEVDALVGDGKTVYDSVLKNRTGFDKIAMRRRRRHTLLVLSRQRNE